MWVCEGSYVLEKLSDVSGPDLVEAGHYRMVLELTLAVHRRMCRSCAGMVRMARVVLEWSHSMAHALTLDTQTWPRGDVPGLGLTDKDVSLLRG